jgi:hypothetical protein
MNREMVTDPLGVEDLWADLRINLKHLQELGVQRVLMLFGFSWGKFIYGKDQPWHDMPVPLDAVETMLTEAHQKGYGALGHDNVYITIPAMDARLQYSHEIDIHLSFETRNAFVTAVLDRWTANQWFTEKQPR